VAGSTAADTAVMEKIIEDASRAIDGYCGRRFYATSETHYLDYPVPYDDAVFFDDDLIAAASVVGGDGVTVTGYKLWPVNALAKAGMLANTGTSWAACPSGDTMGTISVAGSWGYVDRGASVGSVASNIKSIAVINVTRRACLIIAAAYYRKRFGQNVEAAQVTGAGVVLTPQGIPKDAAQLLEAYVRRWG
jgi:hypothetical protein